jgi:hypothetical protein
MLMLNTIQGSGVSAKGKVLFFLHEILFGEKTWFCLYFQNYGGFSFEFDENKKIQSQAIVRRKAKVKSDQIEKPTEITSVKELFKKTSNPEEPGKNVRKDKKKNESNFNLEEILSKDTNYEIPQQLPTVDFPDVAPKKDKKSRKKLQENKKKFSDKYVEHQNTIAQLKTVDFTDEPPKFYDKNSVKEPKAKFSKITNPFPKQKKNRIYKSSEKNRCC